MTRTNDVDFDPEALCNDVSKSVAGILWKYENELTGGRLTEWNKVDLLTCFEVEPEIGEDALSYCYLMERSGYRLSFVLYPYDEDVYISLHGPSQSLPLLELWLHGCIAVRYFRKGELEGVSFKYRDIERLKPQLYQAAELRVRPEFSLTVTR
jgi:hypothetical protein